MSDPSTINTDAHTNNAEAALIADAAKASSSPRPATAAAAQLDMTAAIVDQGTKEDEVKEPLCLEYATPEAVPLHLRQLLSQYSESSVNAAELLLLLIYLVALESGFVEDQSYAKNRELLKPVPAVGCFHIYNVRLLSQQPMQLTREFGDTRFGIHLRTLLNDNSLAKSSAEHTLQSHLMAVVSGDLLIVTLSPVQPSSEPGFSACLSIGRFVLNVQLQPIYQRFRKLDELSLQLRQKLFHPMRSQQLLAKNLHLHPTLLALPLEVYEQIFHYLTKNQLNIVANVNWKLCACSKELRKRWYPHLENIYL